MSDNPPTGDPGAKSSTKKADSKTANAPAVYYPVKTGDTVKSITEACGETDSAALLDLNRETIATHLNFHLGEDEAEKSPDGITEKTKLLEGQSFLLPSGWKLPAEEK